MTQIDARLDRCRDAFYDLIRRSPFGMYLVDSEFRLAEVSAGARSMFADVHPLFGRDFADVLREVWCEPFASEAIACVRHTLSTGEPYEGRETAALRAQGSSLSSYDWRLERVKLPDGSHGVVCSFYDMTERDRAARALRESEQRWSLFARIAEVTRALIDPLQIVQKTMEILREHLRADRCAWAQLDDDEDYFFFVGDAVAPGVPRVEGRFHVATFGSELIDEARAGRQAAISDALTELPPGPVRDMYASTGIRALISTAIRKGGRIIAGTGVHMLSPRVWTAEELELVRQVTERCWESMERARVERALRESEERYRAVVDSQTDALCRYRADGTVLFVNPAYARALGKTPEALVGAKVWDLVPERDRGALRRMLSSLSRNLPEVRVETSDGERWTLWTNRALAFDAAGRPLEVQSSGVDITERKRMEEALREADRRKNEFLAILAHELRNPLAPIRNAAHVLKLAGRDEHKRRWAADVIERQTAHLMRLVEDLLDVSRITQGTIKLTRETLDLGQIVLRAVEANQPLISGRGHELTIVSPRKPVLVEGDPTRLVQVVGNLLNNAAKYTEQGGHIRVAVEVAGDEAVVRVRDDGKGIPCQLLPFVFDPFTQADHSLDRSHAGLGVGLTVVRRLVELHGGRVEVHSEGPGHGSEFVVRLPLEAGAKALRHVEAARSSGPARRKSRVLVVEDNLDAAEAMASLLELGGHDVQVAHSGQEALGAAGAFRPELVLCDIGLPNMSGYEVAAKLRAQPEFAHIRLVAISGYGRDEDRARAREAGFDQHLTKPVEPDRLEALLESLGTEASP